jgi:serine protease Do
MVKMRVVRDGKPLILPVMITELPAESAAAPATEINNALKGVTVQDLNADVLKQLGITREIQGVVVMNIDEESRALGVLKRGDIVMEINRKPVRSIIEFRDAASKIAGTEDILLLVMRGGFVQYITLAAQ